MKISIHFLFAISLVLNSLSSVAILEVPAPWIGLLLVLPLGFLFFLKVTELYRPLYIPVFLILVWAVLFNITEWTDFEEIFPMQASTPYPVYIVLRYLSVVSFVACVAVVVRLCRTGGESRIIALVVNLGVAVSIYAIYVYFAQLYGWPELLPRSRIGTAGGEQATTFTYAFHRAMGSFREPSHLAEWLMVPFALSFSKSLRYLEARKLLIGASILLTGSMTGIMSLAIGFIVANFVVFMGVSAYRIDARTLTQLGGTLVLLFLLVFGTNWALNGLLFEAIDSRSREIILGGVQESNRGYVYEYLSSIPFPIFGDGLGNANIAFSAGTGNSLITSFLSLYFNVLYSLGIFGLCVFVLLLGYPIYHACRINMPGQRGFLFTLVWAYMAWLVAFAVDSEELTVMFGVAYGLLAYNIFRRPPTVLSHSRIQ